MKSRTASFIHPPLALLGLLALTLAAACSADPIGKMVGELQGQWVSAGCEDVGGGFFLVRRFTFAGAKWKDNGTVFSDSSCRTAAFQYDSEGAFSLLEPSRVVSGA